MRNLKLKSVLVLAVSVMLAVIMAVSASAEITVKNGVVIGLDASTSYEYAPVTILNKDTAPAYTALAKGKTSIEGLTPGVWFIRNTANGKIKAVWIAGDEEDRNDIGDVYYNETIGKNVVRTKSTSDWVVGQWTGPSSINHSTFATYYLSSHGHISASDAQNLGGSVSWRTICTKLKSVFYQYAYTPEEIIPVDELYNIGFNVGVRQSSFDFTYSETAADPNMKTIYELYTVNENGEFEVHKTKHNVAYKNGNYQSINILGEFPDASGWIIGIKIYPYGEVPTNGLTVGSHLHVSGIYIATCYYVEYTPSAYTTKYKSGELGIPFQYNGANSSYIKGYGDGSFNPDGSITKAEAAAILARIITENDVPNGSTSKFSDYSVNDWYFNEVNYLERQGAFNYISGAKLQAELPVSRGELAQMIYGLAKFTAKDKSSFKDVDDSCTYKSAILALADNGIIEGYGDGTFRPDATITRAEAVTLFNRMVNLSADEGMVVESTLSNTFNDIDRHWAKNQILIAANDNVKSVRHQNADASNILQTDESIVFETDHMAVTIGRKDGKITSLINKYNGSNILGASTTPWFTYITVDAGFNFSPKYLEVVDNRLHVIYANGTEAYFVLEFKGGYFTIELDSNVPYGVKQLHFGCITVNTPYSDDDEDSYRISAVSMNKNTNMVNRPGGSTMNTTAYTMRFADPIGAKLGITFSRFGGSKNGEHRQYLKDILDAIDENVGIRSTQGSAYTYDNTAPFGDYVIQSANLTASTATETAQTLKKYSIDQLDFHQGGSSFIQGDFNFKCAAISGETFTTAAQFKERVGNLVTKEGIQLGLHTYTSLISSSATNILTNPKWQRQIAHRDSETLTLAEDVAADATVFLTNEDPSGIKLYGEASGGGTSSLPWSGPNTGYFLIDEEIVLVTTSDTTGLTTVSRGKCGTTAVAHSAGAEIIHYLGHYGMFQSEPGSELFYHIADLTAQAYNDGGFEMIYLDGFESFTSSHFTVSEERWYYQAAFIQRLVSQCIVDPIIEGSDFPVSFWNARARAGAVDHAVRETKKYNFNHLKSNRNYLKSYVTATLGWFNYGPDITQAYKNTYSKTMFLDDLDCMGSMGVAFDMSTVANGFSVSTYNSYPTISNNTMYYSLYSRLRKGGYFSDAVKKTLQQGILDGKEYKLEEQADGSWAFRETKYFKNKVFDLSDTTYATGKGTNPYNEQTPYIRIEQRFSTKSKNEKLIYAFDETAEVSTLATKKFTFTATDLSSYRAFKIKVYGNGNPNDAILLTLGSASISETGRLDFFLPTAHTGWREFILVDADNADYDGYEFPGDYITSVHYATFRNGYSFKDANSVTVNISGSCEGVMIDDLKAYTLSNSPVKNPSVTINGKTITFSTTVRSGEYIEYFPALGKAYLHSYNKVTGKADNGNTATVKQISFSGSVTVPTGDFTYTYNATSGVEWYESLLDPNYLGGPIRAKVVIGLQSSELIKNEDSWTAPAVELPEDIQYVTLK